MALDCDRCGREVGHIDELNVIDEDTNYEKWICHSCNGKAGYMGGSSTYKSDSYDDDDDDDY